MCGFFFNKKQLSNHGILFLQKSMNSHVGINLFLQIKVNKSSVLNRRPILFVLPFFSCLQMADLLVSLV